VITGGLQKVGYAVSADGFLWFKKQDAALLAPGTSITPAGMDIGDTGFYQDDTNFYVSPMLTINKVNLLSMADH
jgi:hypothetical protein